jgi:hypothetical protein
MSDYKYPSDSRNHPGSDRFSPSRITTSCVVALLIFIMLFVPAAAAAPGVNGLTPATGLNITTVAVTDLNGTGFVPGATVLLTPVNANPVHKGSLQNGSGGALLDTPFGVYVSGNYAYVASSGNNALEIVDISNPASPVHAGNIVDGSGGALLDSPFGVYVSGNYAYVTSAGGNALEIIDISNPASPVHAGSIVDGSGGALLDSPWGVSVSGNYAYITGYYSSALEIVDVTDPANPLHTGSLLDGGGSVPCLSLPAGLYVSGNYTYVAVDGSNTLEIVNVTNPASPEHAGRLDDGSGVAPFLDDPLSVFISGNYAYTASSGSNAMEIVDISDPANPVHKGSIPDGSGGALLNRTFSLVVSGKYAYITSQNNSALEIVDIGTIPAASVNVVSPSRITCTVNLTGAVPGLYNVVVTNPDGSFGTLPGGFAVIGATPTTPTPTPIPTATPTPTPTFTPLPTPTPAWTPAYDNSGSDSDPTPVPTPGRKMMITVNVGGYSGIYRANVTGTGISDLIITGSAAFGPGQGISPAPGTVYEYTDLVPARYTTIQEAAISYSVPRLWLDGNDLIPQGVAIYRLSNSTWNVLPTTLEKSEGGRSYYTARSPGLGRFAITGELQRPADSVVQGQEMPQGTSNDVVKASVTQVVPTVSRTPVPLQTTGAPAQPATQPSAGFSSFTIVALVGIIILIALAIIINKRKSDL